MPTHESINTSVFEELKSIAGGDFSMLIDSYFIDAEQKILELETAVQRGDNVAIAACAHSFRSSSGNLGFSHLSEILFELERWAKENDNTQIVIWVPRAAEELLVLKQFLNNPLNPSLEQVNRSV